MLIDLRVYRYLPGKFHKFLRSYEQFGFPLTSRHLGKTLGIFTSESGVQNRTFQFFMYESSGHRERCRIGMLADPEFHAFVKMDSDALLEQMNTLLRPTAFSPVGGERLPPPVLVTEGPARIFELTTWTARSDRFEEALKLLNDHATGVDHATGAFAGVGPQTIGYFVAHTGCLAQILRLTAFGNEEDRDAHAALAATDSDLRSFQTALRSLIVHEDSTLLCPTAYSPLR
jgi:hypothetical protein